MIVNTADVLKRLGLTDVEVSAIKRQGFITAETRGRRTVVYKLRFRLGGRQRVRYLGTDAAFIEDVRRILGLLQNARRVATELRAIERSTEQLLRRAKQQLAADLERAGYRFHGRAIRRTRRPTGQST